MVGDRGKGGAVRPKPAEGWGLGAAKGRRPGLREMQGPSRIPGQPSPGELGEIHWGEVTRTSARELGVARYDPGWARLGQGRHYVSRHRPGSTRGRRRRMARIDCEELRGRGSDEAKFPANLPGLQSGRSGRPGRQRLALGVTAEIGSGIRRRTGLDSGESLVGHPTRPRPSRPGWRRGARRWSVPASRRGSRGGGGRIHRAKTGSIPVLGSSDIGPPLDRADAYGPARGGPQGMPDGWR